MKRIERAVAALQLMLIFPAALFMASLFVRNLGPRQYEPARTAQAIVNWYAAQVHIGLWLLLTALPSAAMVMGYVALRCCWDADVAFRRAAQQFLLEASLTDSAALIRPHLALFLVGAVTVATGGFLVIVGLHVLAN